MAYYRIYCFGRDQHIQAFTEAHCDTDTEALTQAQSFLARFTRVEVWERGRMVQRLDSQAGPGVLTSVIASSKRTCTSLADAFVPFMGAPAGS